MITCEFCDDVFKYSNAKANYQEHYSNFHAKPKRNKDNSIQLNAVHQICLIIKGKQKWDNFLEKEKKRNDESAVKAIKELSEFEEKNNIKFHYRNQVLGFRCLN